MKELSLNILDIVQNSIASEAKNIAVSLIVDENEVLTLSIVDDGLGMTSDTLKNITDPFYTSRTSRRVGMGIPLLQLASEQAGGQVTISSKHISECPKCHGTVVIATFDTKHPDFTPVGDIVSSICAMIQGHPEADYLFCHETDTVRVRLDTKELKATLGEGIPLSNFEIIQWISEFLREQYKSYNFNGGKYI